MANTRTAAAAAKPKSAPKPAPKPKTAANAAPVARKRPAAKTKVAAGQPAAPKVAVRQAAAPKVAAAAPTPKPAKQKLVRDSFTIPRSEYAVLDALKARLVKLARPAKKSEVLRAGIKLLDTLPDAALLQALGAVPPIKTGRPGKTK